MLPQRRAGHPGTTGDNPALNCALTERDGPGRPALISLLVIALANLDQTRELAAAEQRNLYLIDRQEVLTAGRASTNLDL